ncbi:MAG TPA: hypothetical protein VFO01_17820 [Trebonia sp.]|nr:hypothetical protein [Trebonia sp.]
MQLADPPLDLGEPGTIEFTAERALAGQAHNRFALSLRSPGDDRLNYFGLDNYPDRLDDLVAVPVREYMRLGETEGAELTLWFAMPAALPENATAVYTFQTFPAITGCGALVMAEPRAPGNGSRRGHRRPTGSARRVFRVCRVRCCPRGRRRVPRAARHGGVPGLRGAFAYQGTTSVSGSRRLRGRPVCEEGGRGRPVCEEGGAASRARRRGPPDAAGGGGALCAGRAARSV